MPALELQPHILHSQSMERIIPVIDLFAGPGGLSEGFTRHAAWSGSDTTFRSVLSIEKSEAASRTLTLRTFYRQFLDRDLPREYWDVVKGDLPETALHTFPEWATSTDEVWRAELGAVPIHELHGRIARQLDGARNWLLLGGPPCQAYSLMGRARMTGIGYKARSDPNRENLEAVRQERLKSFGNDVRHTLYREYLRILAVHQPAVFVMENVKGILSAKVPGTSALMFDRIRADLIDPWSALADDPDLNELTRFASTSRPNYRLHAFAPGAAGLWTENPDNRDFLIRSEEFGIPQKRHRVIILGVREDLSMEAPAKLRNSLPSTVRDAIGHLPALTSFPSRVGDNEWRVERDRLVSRAAEMVGEDVGRALRAAMLANTAKLDTGGRFVKSFVTRPNSALELWLRSSDLDGFLQHEARSHMISDLARYLYMSASASVLGRSPKLEEWPSELLPAHRNVGVNSTTGKPEASGFSDRFKVQMWDHPSSTVTSHIAKDGHYFIHPDPVQCRSLTVREAARLQTFPDDYFFCGNRTEAYAQIGNAVPPYLGVQLAAVVAPLFESLQRTVVSDAPLGIEERV